MRCPTLHELPPPPPGKTGWPWTEESPQLPDAMPDGSPWPRVSIVTPSYNQGQFIEETIRSVLLQGYPNLEYMIIDGGSTDESVEIIRKYEPWLTYWVSEPDRGQAHAINKGFERATGDVLGYLNSDDYFFSQMVWTGVKVLHAHPDCCVVHSNAYVVNESSEIVGEYRSKYLDSVSFIQHDYICQPATLFRRDLWNSIGPFNEHLHFVLDYAYWLQALLQGFGFCYVDQFWAAARMWEEAKSHAQSLEMALEQLDYFQHISQTALARQWPTHWWNSGIAATWVQLAWAAGKSGQMDTVLEALRSASVIAPDWLSKNVERIAAPQGKILVDRLGLEATGALREMTTTMKEWGPVGACLGHHLAGWVFARIAERYWQQEKHRWALLWMTKALLKNPRIIRDHYFGRQFAKTIVKSFGRKNI